MSRIEGLNNPRSSPNSSAVFVGDGYTSGSGDATVNDPFRLTGDSTTFITVEDGALIIPGIPEDTDCWFVRLGAPTFASDPLLMKLDPGRSPNLGKANCMSNELL